jgi:hypothetical protein
MVVSLQQFGLHLQLGLRMALSPMSFQSASLTRRMALLTESCAYILPMLFTMVLGIQTLQQASTVSNEMCEVVRDSGQLIYLQLLVYSFSKTCGQMKK